MYYTDKVYFTDMIHFTDVKHSFDSPISVKFNLFFFMVTDIPVIDKLFYCLSIARFC